MSAEDSEAVIGESLLANKSRPRLSDQVSMQPFAVSDWSWCGTRVPKNQVTYMTQVILVYGIIAVSLAQLILQSTDRELWLVLLSTSVGYVLPSPRLKFLKPKISVSSATASAPTTTAATSSTALPLPPFPLPAANDVGTYSSNEPDTEFGKDQTA